MGSIAPLRVALGVAAATAVLHGAGAWGIIPWLETPELTVYDFSYVTAWRMRRPPPPDERLLLLAYDEKTRSAEESLGLPTWRHTLAALVEKSAELGARTVFLDFTLEQPIFGDIGDRLEASTSSALLHPDDRKKLDQAIQDLRPDARLAAAMRRVPTMLIFGCAPGLAGADSGWRPELEERSGVVRAPGEPPRLRRVGRLRLPYGPLLETATLVAHSCEFPDPDGVVRSDPAVLAVSYPGGTVFVPSAATMLARETLGLPQDAVLLVRDGLQIGDRIVPLDDEGEALIGYSGPAGSFRGQQGKPARHSALELLRDELPASRVRGKIVMIGETLQGGRDMKLTPFGYGTNGRTPGVEKIAMQADYLARPDRYLARPAWVASFGFLFTLLVGVGAALAGGRLGLRPSLPLILVSPALFLLGAVLLAFGGMWVDTAFPAISWTACLLTAALVKNAGEARARRFLEGAFERYVPPEMVRAIVRDPSALKLAGEEREMTVLFADLRDFTTFSEGATPGEVVAHLNEHLTLMSEVIQKHGGTVDKFIGDAVMAFWGAPLPDADHALHACEAAREMLSALDRKNEERIVRGLPMADMGIGLNTGPMIVGNMGSERRFNYTVIGDAVNLASRLESLTKDQHVRILAGARTVELAQIRFPFTPLGELTVKGKQDRVRVFSLAESGKASGPAPKGPASVPRAARKP